MKRMKFIVLNLICFFHLASAQSTIDFGQGTLLIKGKTPSLEIIGTTTPKVKLSTNLKHKKSKDQLIITLVESEQAMKIEVPVGVNIVCQFDPIVYETGLGRADEFWKVKISNLKGDLEFHGDGYDVSLEDLKGSVSVVTYGDIQAQFEDLTKSSLISLDTYWGEVAVTIPTSTPANLNLTAMNGAIDLSSAFTVTKSLRKFNNNFIGQINGGGLDIILHSEDGKKVSIDKG